MKEFAVGDYTFTQLLLLAEMHVGLQEIAHYCCLIITKTGI
jgi:hypothetical protein